MVSLHLATIMYWLLLQILIWGGRTRRLFPVAQQQRYWLQEKLSPFIGRARDILVSPKPVTANLKRTIMFKEEEHWKIDCPRLKKKKGPKLKGNYCISEWCYWFWLFSVFSLLFLQLASYSTRMSVKLHQKFELKVFMFSHFVNFLRRKRSTKKTIGVTVELNFWRKMKILRMYSSELWNFYEI